MPTYQYACTECVHTFDQVQSFTEPSLTDCPECTGRLRKVFNAVGVVFKGSGFYRNDSRAESKSAGNGTSTASTGQESSKQAAATTASDTGSGSSAGTSSTGSSGSNGSSSGSGTSSTKDSGGRDSAANSSGTSSKAPAGTS